MRETASDMELQADTPDMAPPASELIYLTMGKMADYLFGADDPRRARGLIEGLYRLRRNRFSYEFGCTALLSGEVAGLQISYSGRAMRALELPMALQLIRLAGISGFARFRRRALPLVSVKEAEDDEYFIDNVAVLPAYQGKGLGSHLLRWAEKTARGQGFCKLSLTVAVENDRARSLYKRTGFEVIQTVKVQALRERSASTVSIEWSRGWRSAQSRPATSCSRYLGGRSSRVSSRRCIQSGSLPKAHQ